MNALASSILWLSIQVAIFSLVGCVAFFAVRRRGPQAGATCTAIVLAFTLVLTLLAVSPWPRWVVDAKPQAAAAPTSFDHAEVIETVEAAPESLIGENNLALNASPSLLETWWETAVEFVRTSNATPAAEESSSTGWRTWLFMLIVGGVGLCGVRLLLGLFAVNSLRRNSRKIEDADLLASVESIARKVGAASVEVRETSLLRSAVTIGWRKPVVLLPQDWPTWTEAERRAVLAHELVHVARSDYATAFLARVATAIHFYQPLVLWLNRQLRMQQELAADAQAAEISGDRKTYLTTLAQLALRADEQPLPWAARAFLPNTSSLIKRVAWLKRKGAPMEKTLGNKGRWLLAGVMAAIALAVAGIRGPTQSSFALAQESTGATQASPSASTLSAQEAVAKYAETTKSIRSFDVYLKEVFTAQLKSLPPVNGITKFALFPDGEKPRQSTLLHRQVVQNESFRTERIDAATGTPDKIRVAGSELATDYFPTKKYAMSIDPTLFNYVDEGYHYTHFFLNAFDKQTLPAILAAREDLRKIEDPATPKLFVVETAPKGGHGWRLWLDPANGYLPVRIDRFGKSMDELWTSTKIDEFKTIDGGIRMPVKATITSFISSPKSDFFKQPREICELSVDLERSNWNKKIDSSEFELILPPDTRVFDERRSQARPAEKKAEPNEKQPSASQDAATGGASPGRATRIPSEIKFELGRNPRAIDNTHGEFVSDDIRSATAFKDANDQAAISLVFTDSGVEKMKKLTQERKGRPLFILIGANVLATPVVGDAIVEKAQITGRFTLEEAEKIAKGILAK